MAEKLSDKLKGLFKRADTSLGKSVDRLKSYPAKIKSLPKKGYDKVKIMQNVLAKSIVGKGAITKKPKLSTSKALTVFDPKKGLPAKASQLKKVGKFGKLKSIARVASRAALPVAAGFEAANLAYKVATLSPEKKAKVKKLKTKLSKKSTKDYHADLLKMSTGGDTMLKDPKKADLDKDGKLSGYEKKRGKAIESNMKQKPIKAALGIATMGLLGAKMLSDKKKKKAIKAVSPVAMLADVTKPEDKNQVTTGQQTASKGKMMKARYGTMAKGDVKEGLKKSKIDKAELSKFKVMATKKLSGAQISETEYDKLKDMMPKITDSGSVRESKKKTIKAKLSKLNKAKSGKMMKAKSGKMIEANMGMEAKSTQGYGAARTSGMGLQDENLIPGKSLDYYKDIM